MNKFYAVLLVSSNDSVPTPTFVHDEDNSILLTPYAPHAKERMYEMQRLYPECVYRLAEVYIRWHLPRSGPRIVIPQFSYLRRRSC